MRKMMVVLPFVLVLVLMIGCAKPPQAAIDGAKAALDSAKAAEAAEYADDSLRSAQDAVAALEQELKAQEEKFALFRSYKKAEELAASAKAAGDKASADAEAGKEAAKQAATEAIAALNTALTEAKEMLDKAPRGKGTQADLEMMKADLSGAETAAGEAQSLLDRGKYNDASAKAGAAMDTVTRTKDAITAAMEAKKGRR